MGHIGHYLAYCTSLGWWASVEQSVERELARINRKTRRKPAWVPLHPYDLTWDRTRISEVWSQRLTASVRALLRTLSVPVPEKEHWTSLYTSQYSRFVFTWPKTGHPGCCGALDKRQLYPSAHPHSLFTLILVVHSHDMILSGSSEGTHCNHLQGYHIHNEAQTNICLRNTGNFLQAAVRIVTAAKLSQISQFYTLIYYSIFDRAIARAVSRRLHTAAVRFRPLVRSRGICGGQNDAAAGFLQVIVPEPLIPQTSHTYHPSYGSVTTGQIVDSVSLHPKN
jgi:hypothetical protein